MSAALGLQSGFDGVTVRRLAHKTEYATQHLRPLALAEFYDGSSRSCSARIFGLGQQIMW